jgi:hypothetical protein
MQVIRHEHVRNYVKPLGDRSLENQPPCRFYWTAGDERGVPESRAKREEISLRTHIADAIETWTFTEHVVASAPSMPL